MATAETLDLRYAGRPGLISAFLVPTGDGGFVLLDSGPASGLTALENEIEAAGFTLSDLRAVLLTHIHLDHAAAAGTLARRTGCQVWVHPAGAFHVGSPESKLLPSARRLYGDQLEVKWGAMEGVPERLLHEVEHGEPLRFGDLKAVGWHTPGHARHHVAWHVGDSVATGDVGGVRLQGPDYVLPPTPPPDIDVSAWLVSIDLVRKLEPAHLLLTHFGSFDDPGPHLDQLAGRLRRWSRVAGEVVGEGGDSEELERRLIELDHSERPAEGIPDDLDEGFQEICPMADNAAGLHRWATKQPGV